MKQRSAAWDPPVEVVEMDAKTLDPMGGRKARAELTRQAGFPGLREPSGSDALDARPCGDPLAGRSGRS
jgi:hypothetical protein